MNTLFCMPVLILLSKLPTTSSSCPSSPSKSKPRSAKIEKVGEEQINEFGLLTDIHSFLLLPVSLDDFQLLLLVLLFKHLLVFVNIVQVVIHDFADVFNEGIRQSQEKQNHPICEQRQQHIEGTCNKLVQCWQGEHAVCEVEHENRAELEEEAEPGVDAGVNQNLNIDYHDNSLKHEHAIKIHRPISWLHTLIIISRQLAECESGRVVERLIRNYRQQYALPYGHHKRFPKNKGTKFGVLQADFIKFWVSHEFGLGFLPVKDGVVGDWECRESQIINLIHPLIVNHVAGIQRVEAVHPDGHDHNKIFVEKVEDEIGVAAVAFSSMHK